MSCGALALYAHSSSYAHVDHVSHGLGAYGGEWDGNDGHDDHHDYHVSTFVRPLNCSVELNWISCDCSSVFGRHRPTINSDIRWKICTPATINQRGSPDMAIRWKDRIRWWSQMAPNVSSTTHRTKSMVSMRSSRRSAMHIIRLLNITVHWRATATTKQYSYLLSFPLYRSIDCEVKRYWVAFGWCDRGHVAKHQRNESS